ncbi:hypothetical protein NPIL_85581 [Nephila pilipes]|uniref:Uncharacterized protein n=1 Tax=Nephila pilipes TaxID=299642 RepID=A0A8X6UBT6_NEPPI|nr:hypothetical protein NPIL_85581 [Nephila pilipes]
MLLPSNTDRMVAKRRSQAIWTPRNSTSGLGDKFDFGDKNWHHESSSKIYFRREVSRIGPRHWRTFYGTSHPVFKVEIDRAADRQSFGVKAMIVLALQTA